MKFPVEFFNNTYGTIEERRLDFIMFRGFREQA